MRSAALARLSTHLVRRGVRAVTVAALRPARIRDRIQLPRPDAGRSRRRPDEKSFRGYERIHLSSRDRRELYLEVVRFHDLTPEDEYVRHKPYLAQRFGAGSISSLTGASLQDWPAYRCRFGWTEEARPVERSVLLLVVAGETYRIIFDPRSELNARVIATLTTAA
jgi:hypothetical protein